MKTNISRTVFKCLVVALCLITAIFSFRGTLDPVTNRLGTSSISSQNDEYLNATFKKGILGFGTMTGIKTVLAIIEGSTVGFNVGVNAKLEVGDVVQATYDYVDIAWRTLLLGCIAILSTQYILAAATLLDGYILAFTLFLLAISLTLRWWGSNWIFVRNVVRDTFSLSVVASIAVYYILPISVWGASRLSLVITQPVIEEAQTGFSEIKNTLSPDEDEESSDAFFSKIKDIPERVQQIAAYLKLKSSEMVVWTIKLIAGYIFDCIVFPLALFTLLLWLTRSIMRYVFHKNLQASLRDDLRRLLKQ